MDADDAPLRADTIGEADGDPADAIEPEVAAILAETADLDDEGDSDTRLDQA